MEKIANRSQYNLYKILAIILIAAALLLGLIRGFGTERQHADRMLERLETAHAAMLRNGADALLLARRDAPGEAAALIDALESARSNLDSSVRLGDKAYHNVVLAYNINELCDRLLQLYSANSSEYQLVKNIKYNIESTGNLIRNYASEYNLQAYKYNKFVLGYTHSFAAALTGNGPIEGYPQATYFTYDNNVKNYFERVFPSFDIGGAVLVVLIAASFAAALLFVGAKISPAKEKLSAKPKSKPAPNKNPVIPGKTPPHRRK